MPPAPQNPNPQNTTPRKPTQNKSGYLTLFGYKPDKEALASVFSTPASKTSR